MPNNRWYRKTSKIKPGERKYLCMADYTVTNVKENLLENQKQKAAN